MSSTTTIILFIAAALCCSMTFARPGGFSAEKEANEWVKSLVTRLESSIKAHLGATSIKRIKPISFRQQVVAGYNFRIKVS